VNVLSVNDGATLEALTLTHQMSTVGAETNYVKPSSLCVKTHNAARNLRAETGACLARVLLRSGLVRDQQGA